jgi:outer membrane protein assembly factor BamB
MDQYKDLLKVPGNDVEEQKRQGHFWRLAGKGWEGQGDLVRAYQAYREFSGLRLYQQGGVPTLDDPLRKIPMQVWLRARMSSMFAAAKNEEQKKPLEKKIEEEWAKVRDSGQVDAIRGFVAMFDSPFKVGREARLKLADAIIAKNDRGGFLEAELNLEQLLSNAFHGTVENARALDALARLEIRKGSGGSMKIAADYYRRLAAQFPDTVIRDGKTGKALLNALATDKRFLGYLDPAGATWGAGKFKYQELAPGTIPAEFYAFVFQPQGAQTQATANLRLVLSAVNANAQIQLVDLSTNKTRWSQTLKYPPNNFQVLNMYFGNVLQQALNNPSFYPKGRFRSYQVRGHLAVLQIGTEVYCIDMETPKLLWSQSLLEMPSPQVNNISPQQIQMDQDGNPEVMVYNFRTRMRYRMRIGQVGTVQASYVALLKEDELVVLDPLTGNVLWKKAEIPEDTVLFGDDEYIFLVEANGPRAHSGRALRATDGAAVEVNDFSALYQNRLHVYGRRILAGTPINNKMVLRLYDIPTGKDLWEKTFDEQTVLLESPDPNLIGTVNTNTGQVTVFDVAKQKELLTANVFNMRITKQDLQNLHKPLLLADHDHFYVALNQPIDNQQVMGGVLSSNFGNGLRCMPVNGWFVALYRQDGSGKSAGQNVTWKKGDMHWYSSLPVANQMVIVDQFESLPLILFSVRYNKPSAQPGGSQWVSRTQSLDKRTGKWVYCPLEPRATNGVAPQFNTFQVDAKDGTINMIGLSGILQHYVDDGRPRNKEARLDNSGRKGAGVGLVGTSGPPPAGFPGQPGFNPPFPGAIFPGGAFPPGGIQQGGFGGGIPGGAVFPPGGIQQGGFGGGIPGGAAFPPGGIQQGGFGGRGGVIIINGQLQPPQLPPVERKK